MKFVFSNDPALRKRNLKIIGQVRQFLRLASMQAKWESTRASCFDPNALDVVRNIGFGLRTQFPLKRLSEDQRAKLIGDLRKEIEKFGKGPVTGPIEKALVSSLESLVFMLEHHLFFGVTAIRRAAEDAYVQATFLEQSPGKTSREKRRNRKASCRSTRQALWGILTALAIEAPIHLNELLAAYSELPSRLEPIVDVSKEMGKRLLSHTELLALPSPSSSAASTEPSEIANNQTAESSIDGVGGDSLPSMPTAKHPE